MSAAVHAVALLLCCTLAMAQPLVDREQLDKRLDSVGRLLEQSSASRLIEATGDAEAIGRRERARAAYRRAQQARDAGDYAAAARLAGESSALMFEAAKLAGRSGAAGEREQSDFDARLQSVRALLAAQQRIAAEKRGSAEAAEAVRNVQALLDDAIRLRAGGQTAPAAATLNRAYLLAKATVASLRSGETLVRSVHFAKPEEEYRYELERNDTHMTLIKTLTTDEPRIGRVDGAFEGFINRSVELRRQAEASYRAGDPATAIRGLEDSTRELLRAIRSLGIAVPG